MSLTQAPAYLLGRGAGPALADVRRFLDANGAAYRWVDVDELVVHIGGDPLTAGVRDLLRLDPHGFVMTGPDLRADGGGGRWWPLERDPFPLETSYPGLFAAGDVRAARRMSQGDRYPLLSTSNLYRTRGLHEAVGRAA